MIVVSRSVHWVLHSIKLEFAGNQGDISRCWCENCGLILFVHALVAVKLALVQLLVTAASSLDGSCGATIDLEGDLDPNSKDAIPAEAFECALIALGIADSEVQDAVANATGGVTAQACEGRDHVNVTDHDRVRTQPADLAAVLGLIPETRWTQLGKYLLSGRLFGPTACVIPRHSV